MDKKEEVLQGFLSKDAGRVLKSAGEVTGAVITDREFIEELSPHLNEIRKATQGLNYGGGFLRNQRYVEKALEIISKSRGRECLCEYAFTDYGQSVEALEERGFIVLSKRVDRKKFTTIGEIECPGCHQRYIAEEEFTGGHMTSSRHRKVEK